MNSLILAILVPFFTALILALLNGHYRLEKAVALLSSFGLTIWVFWLLFYVDAHGVQVVIIGGWKAPWGIAFVADRLTTIMLCLSTGLGTLVQLYSFWTVTEQQQRYFFYPLMQAVLLGVNWSFITGDLFCDAKPPDEVFACCLEGGPHRRLKATEKIVDSRIAELL